MSAREMAEARDDRKLAACCAASTLKHLLGVMDALLTDLPPIQDARLLEAVDRIAAVQEAAMVFARKVEGFLDGA